MATGAYVVLLSILCTIDATVIGKCDDSTLPKSWASSAASGVTSVAAAGAVSASAGRYCSTFNAAAGSYSALFHMQGQSTASVAEVTGRRHRRSSANQCNVADSRIVQCTPSCGYPNEQRAIIRAAINSTDPQWIANQVWVNSNKPQDMAVQVVQLNMDNMSRRVEQSYPHNSQWCSIRILTKIGNIYNDMNIITAYVLQ